MNCRRIFAALCALSVLMVASVAILGYLLADERLYRMPKDATPMALPTGLCFISLALAVLVLTIRKEDE